MAKPEPPPVITRVVDVKDPGGEFYSVYVRMPSHLASKFPDKPWGTAITDIGLATKDTVKFEGYTLVEIDGVSDRRAGDSPDLFWIFEKLSGPIWTTATNNRENKLPPKFRESITATKTKQDVDPGTAPTTLTGDLVASIVERQDNTGRSVKTEVTEVINDVPPLEGQHTGTWGIEGTTEKVVTEGDTTPSGFLTKESIVVPLGDGKSIESTSTYPAVAAPNVVYTLLEEETDQITAIPVYIKKSLVNASAASALAAVDRTALWFPEIKALDKWHSILISAKLDDSILDFKQNWIETGNIQLPNVLTEVGVIWDSNEKGDFGSTGAEDIKEIIRDKLEWKVRAEANATGVVQGKPYTMVSAGYRGPARVSVERTFVYGPPSSLDASVQPYDFGEVYGTLTVHGEQETVAAQAAKGGKGKISLAFATSTRRHSDGNMSIQQFGPIVHNGVSLTELGDPSTVNASYFASGGSTPSRGFYPTATAQVEATGSATLKLPASGIPLTSGKTYLLNVKMSPYRLGYWVIEKYTATVP
tara:strand:+ start:516 stop:2108 length:1593 start_codon:yes stop_codon:yes gene_type:complete